MKKVLLSIIVCLLSIFVYADFNECMKKAQKGDPVYQHDLGLHYFYGIDVEADTLLAIDWWRKAAKKDLAEAEYNIAFVYEKGLAVEVNIDTALYYYRKSAEHGYAPSQTNIGYFYETGLYLEKDKEKAFYWYALAADQGYDIAMYNLAMLYLEKPTMANLIYAIPLLKSAALNGFEPAVKKINELKQNEEITKYHSF